MSPPRSSRPSTISTGSPPTTMPTSRPLKGWRRELFGEKASRSSMAGWRSRSTTEGRDRVRVEDCLRDRCPGSRTLSALAANQRAANAADPASAPARGRSAAPGRRRLNTRSPASDANLPRLQRQPAALDHHRRLRQHARHRGRAEIRRRAARRRARARGRACASSRELAHPGREARRRPARHGGKTPRARGRRGRDDRPPRKPHWR